jgi:hypothetical protein
MLLLLFILLQVADGYTTVRGLKLGAREGNPILAWLFERFEPVLVLLVVKAASIIAVAVVNSDILTAFVCGVYVPVVLNNIRVLRKKA